MKGGEPRSLSSSSVQEQCDRGMLSIHSKVGSCLSKHFGRKAIQSLSEAWMLLHAFFMDTIDGHGSLAMLEGVCLTISGSAPTGVGIAGCGSM